MRLVKYFVVALVVLSLAACGLGFFGGSDDSQGEPEAVVLPPDAVNDVMRQHSGEFTFETFVAVDLDLDISVLDISSDTLRPAVSAFAPALVATISDKAGNLLYRGMVDEDGHVSGGFAVSTATDSVILTIEGSTVEPREVEIADPSALSTVARGMAVAPVPDQFVRRGGEGTVDTDGDGVPDYYDAAPLDDTIAFITNYPAEGSFTVAYEDLFPNIGDGDFNDFVGVYSVTVYTDGWGGVTFIEGEATARARAAGYDHEFGLFLHIPNFSGTVTSYYYSNAGEPGTLVPNVPVQTSEPVGEDVRIILFPSTKEAFDRPGGLVPDNGYPDQVDSIGKTAKFTVFPNPGNRPPPAGTLPSAPFDPYIVVNPLTATEPVDVHLIDKDPLPGTNNPADPVGFRDPDGYPWALLVPIDFAHPSETSGIWDAYPGAGSTSSFDAWVASAGTTNKDWYLYPDPALVVTMPVN